MTEVYLGITLGLYVGLVVYMVVWAFMGADQNCTSDYWKKYRALSSASFLTLWLWPLALAVLPIVLILWGLWDAISIAREWHER